MNDIPTPQSWVQLSVPSLCEAVLTLGPDTKLQNAGATATLPHLPPRDRNTQSGNNKAPPDVRHEPCMKPLSTAVMPALRLPPVPCDYLTCVFKKGQVRLDTLPYLRQLPLMQMSLPPTASSPAQTKNFSIPLSPSRHPCFVSPKTTREPSRMARGPSSSIRSGSGSASSCRRRHQTPGSGRSTVNPPSRSHDHETVFTPTPTRPLRQDGPPRDFLQRTGGMSSAPIDGVPRGQDRGLGGQIPSDLSNDTEHDHEDSDSVLQEVIMALDMRDGTSMGCAFFTTATGALALSEDVPIADTNVAEHFVTHVQPTTLLVSARAPEHLMDFLEKLAGSGDEAGLQLGAAASWEPRS